MLLYFSNKKESWDLFLKDSWMNFVLHTLLHLLFHSKTWFVITCETDKQTMVCCI